jgi:hypothetical protein
MYERYEYVMKEIDKLNDVDYNRYNYDQLVKNIDNFLKENDKKIKKQ